MFSSKINPKNVVAGKIIGRLSSLNTRLPASPEPHPSLTPIEFFSITPATRCPIPCRSRRLVLLALKIKTHPRQPAYLQICAQLAALESIAELHAQLQVELQNVFQSSADSHRQKITP